MAEEKRKSLEDIFSEAEEAEKNNDAGKAIALYSDIIRQDGLHIDSYNKLMKLFRKSKNYKKELGIIDKGIKAYENYYKKHKPKHSRAISDLSDKLNRSLGLVDKKGNAGYEPEPLGKWKKRRLIVQKKLDK